MALPSHHRKKIVLHVGHGKTGSSYIQSSLALSRAKLFDVDIDYPHHPSFAEAEKGLTTSGNVSVGGWINEVVRSASKSEKQTLVFSNESLAWEFIKQGPTLSSLSAEYDLKVVLFIRNPVSHMTSRYIESIKRFGRTNTIEEHAEFYDVPCQVSQLLQVLSEAKVETEVLNYSNAHPVLLERFYASIEASGISFIAPPIPIVNRSLTLAETEIQRLFNLHYGQTSHNFISKALLKELPGIEIVETPRLDDQAYRAFVQRVKPAIEDVNVRIHPDERYQIEGNDRAEGKGTPIEYFFTPKQLEVIVKAICNEVNKCNDTPESSQEL
jgi:hypothetical protein